MNTTQAIFPNKKYDVIYADPPWDIAGRAWVRGNTLSDHYKTMSISEITELPVDQIQKEDSWLYLWTVDSFLESALKICQTWEFTYKKSWVWVKTGLTRGMGVYNLGNHEQLLLGKRGSPAMPRYNVLQSSVIECRRGSHSTKPVQVKRMIEQYHPNTDKIELFARPLPMFKGLDDGWDYWGNEV